MADENTPQGTPPATPPATPADAGGAAPAAPLVNYKEIVELRKETRENTALLKQFLERESGRSQPVVPPTPTTPAPTSPPPKGDELTTRFQALEGELATMRRDGALKDAFLEHGVTDPDLRDLIKVAAAQASPTDVAGIVAKYAKFKTAAAPAAPATAPAAVPTGTSNTGAAGGESRTQIPSDVLAISKEAWAQLSPEEKRARYEADKRSKGIDVNPFAARRPKPK